MIIIKLSGLVEDLLCQIKSMSTDDMIVDLLMSSQKNHQSYQVNQKKVLEICNEKKDIKVDQDIKIFYDCIIKKNLIYIQ